MVFYWITKMHDYSVQCIESKWASLKVTELCFANCINLNYPFGIYIRLDWIRWTHHHISHFLRVGLLSQLARYFDSKKQKKQEREAIWSQVFCLHRNELGLQLHWMPHLSNKIDWNLSWYKCSLLLVSYWLANHILFRRCHQILERSNESFIDGYGPSFLNSTLHRSEQD